MTGQLEEIVNDIKALPMDAKKYLARILNEDINARKIKEYKTPKTRTAGEYVGKIEMCNLQKREH